MEDVADGVELPFGRPDSADHVGSIAMMLMSHRIDHLNLEADGYDGELDEML